MLAKASGRPTEPLPSWSWCRRQGELILEPWSAAGECLFLALHTQNICRITPIIGWFKVNTHSGARKPIRNWFSSYRGWNHSQFPLSGWQVMSRGASFEEHPFRNGRTDTWKFRHGDIGRSRLFRFAVPFRPYQTTPNALPKEEHWDTKMTGIVQHAFLFLRGRSLAFLC